MSEIRWRREPQRILFQISVMAPAPAADLTAVAASALLDTGSTTSGVTREIPTRLALPQLGRRPLGSARGEEWVERYLFRIGLQTEASLPFVFEEVNGFELRNGFAFEALIGMDVLSHCDFSMERSATAGFASGKPEPQRFTGHSRHGR